MNNTDDKHFLTSLPLFEGLTEEQVDVVSSRLISSVHSSGAILFKEGEPGQAVFIIRSGSIEMYRADDNFEGGDYLVSRLRSGDTFGDFSLVVKSRHLTTAIVGDDCHLLQLSRGHFEQLAADDPRIGFVIVRAILRNYLKPIQDHPGLYFKAFRSVE